MQSNKLDERVAKMLAKQPAISSVPQLEHLDLGKVMSLPNSEFYAFYTALMKSYKTIYGWWDDGRIPFCTECQNVILGPQELRRYHGRSLHPNCFAKYLKSEGNYSGEERKFFERVARLNQ
jgi:hypothetical protein